jgi:hypothetical protein
MSTMERTEAIKAGAVRYNTGRPCKNGHTADRRTLSGKCVACELEKQRRSNNKNRERRNATARAYGKRKRAEIHEARAAAAAIKKGTAQ